MSRPAAVKVSGFLSDYATEKGIYMKINYVNPDHVHALVDLPTNLCLEEAMQLFKGASSHWINESNLVPGKFGWGRGYGAFSVSHSGVGEVARYIADQEEHHRKKSFSEEELVNLTLAIITINGWNRLAITFRWVPGEYQPGMYNTEGVKA